MKIILSAFACFPNKGSEGVYGWNWAIGLAEKGYEVHCITRNIGRDEINKLVKPDQLSFHYVELPFGCERLYESSTIGMYLYYLLWQWFAYRKAKQLHKVNHFQLVHHVTWGSTQLGSFMYKLGIPFIFGPAGGGQNAPIAFKDYFLKAWANERKREIISKWLLKFNPACKNMITEAQTVLVSNFDTAIMVDSVSKNKSSFILDVALSESFFPETTKVKKTYDGKLKLLWIGRFLPRKGILLLLDVMKELADYPDISLTVVGDGEMRDAFLEKIKIDCLSETVFWKGQVPYEEVKHYYQTNDVFFFTSLRDSGGVQLVEAMAYGMPIVCLDIHGQSDIVNEETGIKCKCSNPKETIQLLKEAILIFYNNPELIEEKGNAAYLFAKEQTWNKKIEQIIEKYYPIS